MSQPQRDATVIVASYNQLESTTLALHALAAQKTRYSFEVIVCDDGSDAATVEALQKQLLSLPVPGYLAWQQDKGFRAAASRNNGIRLSRGRVIIMLDGDMVPKADFVEAHVRAHEHEEEKVIAYGKRAWRDIDALAGRYADIDSLWEVLRDESLVDRLTFATEAFEFFYRHILSKTSPWMSCLTCNISVPNLPLVEFDEAFVGWGYEDYDLFYALNVVHGFRVVPVDAIAYEVGGRVDRRKTWEQANFIAHLVNGFRFHDKWADTGLTVEESIPSYDIDPVTGKLDFSERRIIGGPPNEFANYVEEARRWLLQKGLYPEVDPSRLEVDGSSQPSAVDAKGPRSSMSIPAKANGQQA